MNYLKKVNELFIRVFVTLVYIFGIGIARGLLIVSDWKIKKSDTSFWTQADKKNDKTTFVSPY